MPGMPMPGAQMPPVSPVRPVSPGGPAPVDPRLHPHLQTARVVPHRHPTGRIVKLGAVRPDPATQRDPGYALSTPTSDLAPFVDLRPHLTPVEDQGQVGSCTANALAGAIEYLERRVAKTDGRVSRLFIYYNERELEGDTAQDQGAALRSGVQILMQRGACTETTWPYDATQWAARPSDTAYREATAHVIDQAQKVDVELNAMRHCLHEGYPFAFGLLLFKPFEEDQSHGRIRTPNEATDPPIGGHAMLCVGYSDKDRVFLVRNSWGTDWGDQGYCYIPYEYLANPRYAHDFWTVRRGKNLDFRQGGPGVTPPHGRLLSFFEKIP
jgi:C1A family cysteine protease